MVKNNMYLIKLILLSLILISAFSNTYAAIYKYVDEDGRVHYSQTKPGNHTSEKVNVISGPPQKKNTKNTSNKLDNLQSENCGKSGAYTRYGRVFCCNINCVRERIEKGLEVSCEDPRCHQAAYKVKHDMEIAAKNERDARRKKMDEKNQARIKDIRDKKLIADCKKRREVYCNKSADEILKIQAREAKKQQEIDRRHRKWKANNPDLGPRQNKNDIYIN